MTLARSNVDTENELANWGYDDIWRIFWMTIMFCFLLPLSRSAWALKKNFSLAMWLHMVRGVYTTYIHVLTGCRARALEFYVFLPVKAPSSHCYCNYRTARPFFSFHDVGLMTLLGVLSFVMQGLGMGYFFDNWRRRTHPHVWILNTPVLLWYLADKIWCCTRGR